MKPLTVEISYRDRLALRVPDFNVIRFGNLDKIIGLHLRSPEVLDVGQEQASIFMDRITHSHISFLSGQSVRRSNAREQKLTKTRSPLHDKLNILNAELDVKPAGPQDKEEAFKAERAGPVKGVNIRK
jgi:hypothetical protein